MPIALVQSATQVNVASSSSDALAITITGTTAGNCLVAFASIWDNNTTWVLDTVTDGGNTFVVRQANATRPGDRSKAVVAYAVNIAGGDRTVVFNLSGTVGGPSRFYSLGCLEFSGVAATSPEDAFDINETIDTATLDVSAGPITTTQATALIVGAASVNTGADNTLNFASPASWINSYRQNAALDFTGLDAGYWLPGAIQTTYSPQWAHDNNADDFGAGVVVALKASGTQIMRRGEWFAF